MISAERMKSVRMAPLIFVFLQRHQSPPAGFCQRLQKLGFMGLIVFRAMQKLVGQLLETFKAQKGATHHEQRRHQPGRHDTDGQALRALGSALFNKRTLAHRPYHRNLAFCAKRQCHLLRIECEVIPQHTGRFFGGDFAEYRDIVKDGGDVI